MGDLRNFPDTLGARLLSFQRAQVKKGTLFQFDPTAQLLRELWTNAGHKLAVMCLLYVCEYAVTTVRPPGHPGMAQKRAIDSSEDLGAYRNADIFRTFGHREMRNCHKWR